MPVPLRWLAARAERGTSRRVDRVIALTRGDLEAARGRGIMNATVIPNGIDPARFAATTDRRAELGIPDSAPVVGMIARLVPQKDPATFARAAVIAARANPEMRFVLAGDGPLRASVEEEARDLIERRRWISTGFRSDVPELLATLDVVVFPSRWEGLPLTLLEAMAASRAVVASELPGHAEVIRSGENGVLIPAGDAAALAREMSRLIAEPQRRMAMGVEARAHVERHHTVERMVERTAELYRSLLGSSTALEGGVAAPEPERQAE
jgi:glycosyltransferase involved in cell wall biosynthesis